ncbi:signal peptide peptidase SppA, 67K type [Hymenobacter roseosalivarius DSM 11622]|uniref:Signal peptide peptidase SppA, 67K type n=1 Tax=Hymenobacter roseosalivarius DSM 11622 TaxID=645990 RepID=A0A1W1VCM5_9BACT|nr:signal peptide peptidase SppA [Hymenobacter roseosalivarius]SMB91122.1 signal peptide peptidase SppA, 67K type [Hymenobacter roseosalivarius DSM 11622]
MRQFFKYVLATLVGLTAFAFIGFLLLVGVIVSAASSDDEVEVAKNSVLELKLDQPISERESPESLGSLLGGGSSASSGLDQIKEAIRRAKTDDNIKGIFLNVELVQAGMATLEEIRNELLDFKKSGKFLVAYNDLSSEKSYYLASVADKIYLNPQGTLEFNGLSSETYYYKNLFEKAGIEPYIFRVGSFKSAVEPFFRENMSDSARLQTSSFLNSMNDFMLGHVAAARRIAPARLRVISDSMLVHNADDAKRLGLVTDLGYYDQALSLMKKKAGVEADKKLGLVSLSTYQRGQSDDKGSGSNRIAVIYADGDIVTGKGDNNDVGSTRFAEAIRQARLDDKVKAVVLRVNSPGGSSLASDIIYREVVLTKKVKPIVCSMSDVAASGGYFIAMACDTIVAHPNTITGSIGVFGVLPNIQPLLRDKLGITTDRVTTGKFSDLPTITRPLTAYEQQQLQAEVNRIYADFTTKAAKGRHMPVEKLRGYASGRVWSGSEAKQRGLVDVLGSFEDALRIAARRAKLKDDDYRLQRLPRQKTFVENIFDSFGMEARQQLVKQELGPLYPMYEQYQKLLKLQGVQARLPYEMRIE